MSWLHLVATSGAIRLLGSALVISRAIHGSSIVHHGLLTWIILDLPGVQLPGHSCVKRTVDPMDVDSIVRKTCSRSSEVLSQLVEVKVGDTWTAVGLWSG